ncbi:hypothetical protein D9Q98_003483 [Chlorella vulgaris]|uniref:Alpha-amylase n=1 Tax=Chlorella vulgaris TaxID=3077 RepID=A0A9D4TT64_CHLVU|nr:hypothetical protein D9Q98_003483 [Chlorella vulgaris]
MLRQAPIVTSSPGSSSRLSSVPLRRGFGLPRASKAGRWRGLLEADDSVAVGTGLDSPVAAKSPVVEAARQVAEQLYKQPTYSYAAVEAEAEEEVVDRVWRKLDAVSRELRCVTEQEYLNGLEANRPASPRLHQLHGTVSNVVLHPHNLPSLAPPLAPPSPPRTLPPPGPPMGPQPRPEPEHEVQRHQQQHQQERHQERARFVVQPERPPPPHEVQQGVLAPDLPRLEGTAGKAEGTGQEVLLQGFNWESWKHNWFDHIAQQAQELAQMGFTTVWLPPFTDSVSEQGYMPRDLYNLNSRYGSESQLINCVRSLQQQGIKVLGDAVLNHRCAQHQGAGGVWNQFGGKMTWDERAIVGDQSEYGGRGNRSSGESFSAAPNIDHSQPFVKRDLCEWMIYLRQHVGFDGWRLDFVKGFHGSHVRDYLQSSLPQFVVGEYWDSLSYGYDGTPNHNQDAHRKRIVNWIEAAGGLATAFDITSKGIMHAVFERCEYWRLADEEGKPPGLMGWWPSRAVTFLENHDTGSTQGHWRFPHHALEQGYVYILSHPGTPTVFYDHLYDRKSEQLRHLITRLIHLRKRLGINCRSKVKILAAERDVYAAEIDGKLIMKIGPGDFAPEDASPVDCGHCWTLWEKNAA